MNLSHFKQLRESPSTRNAGSPMQRDRSLEHFAVWRNLIPPRSGFKTPWFCSAHFESGSEERCAATRLEGWPQAPWLDQVLDFAERFDNFGSASKSLRINASFFARD
jgi:hypothetical protein